MAQIDTIADFKTGDDVDVPERLNELRDAVKAALLNMLSATATAQSVTATDAAQVALDRLKVSDDLASVQQALADAVAVVTNGQGALFSSPGGYPLAGVTGQIDAPWLSPMVAAQSGRLAEGGGAVAIVPLGAALDRDPQWPFKCQDQGYYNIDLPSGDFLGEAATVAAAVALPDAVAGAYYHETGTNVFRVITNIETPAASAIYRAGSKHFPVRGFAVIYPAYVVIYDTRTGRPVMWAVIPLVHGDARGGAYAEGQLFIFGHTVLGDNFLGLARLDFKNSEIYLHRYGSAQTVQGRYIDGPFTDLFRSVGVQWVNASNWSGYISSVPVITSSDVNAVEVVRQDDGDLALYVGTDEGLSRIVNLIQNPSETSRSDTSGGSYDVVKHIELIGGRVLVALDAGEDAKHVLALSVTEPLSDADYNNSDREFSFTGGTSTSGLGIAGASLNGSDNAVKAVSASDQEAFFATDVGVLRAIYCAEAAGSSLLDAIASNWRTGYVQGDASVLACDNDAVRVSDVELITGDNSTFTAGVGDWVGNSNARVASVGGELEVTSLV